MSQQSPALINPETRSFRGHLYRVILRDGETQVLEFPRVLLGFYNRFHNALRHFRPRDPRETLLNVNIFIQVIGANPLHHLHHFHQRILDLQIGCRLCILRPCTYCRFFSSAVHILSDIEREWAAAIRALSQHRLILPDVIIHNIASFCEITDFQLRAERIVALLEFISRRRFAPEIGSRINRFLFNTWADAVGSNRLIPFVDPDYSHDGPSFQGAALLSISELRSGPYEASFVSNVEHRSPFPGFLVTLRRSFWDTPRTEDYDPFLNADDPEYGSDEELPPDFSDISIVEIDSSDSDLSSEDTSVREFPARRDPDWPTTRPGITRRSLEPESQSSTLVIGDTYPDNLSVLSSEREFSEDDGQSDNDSQFNFSVI